MEENMPEFKGRDRFFWKIYQKDDDNEIFSKENVLYFAELCKFAACLETLDLTDEKNLWFYMLTHVADIREEELRQMDHQRFYNECLISNLTDMEKKIYVRNVLEYDDVQESLMCVREDSLKQGFDKGVEQGRAEGREQGREEATKQLVRSLMDNGFDVPTIVKVTGLTEEEILTIGDEMTSQE